MRICSITPVAGAIELRVYEIGHSADSGSFGKNSCGATAPSVAALIRAASPQDGRLMPRLMREIVTLSALMIPPKRSSSNPLAIIQSESVMPEFVHYVHSSCQAQCARHAVDQPDPVRRMYGMVIGAKKSAKYRSLPEHESYKSYLLAWRHWKQLSQVRAGDLMGKDHSLVGKIERDEVAYTPEYLDLAARAYGCTKGDLLDRNPWKAPPITIDPQIAVAIVGLDNDQVLALVRLAKTIKKAG